MEACTVISQQHTWCGGLKCFYTHTVILYLASDNVKLKWTHNHVISARYMMDAIYCPVESCTDLTVF